MKGELTTMKGQLTIELTIVKDKLSKVKDKLRDVTGELRGVKTITSMVIKSHTRMVVGEIIMWGGEKP